MDTDSAIHTISSRRLWVGRGLSALPALLFLFSATLKLMAPPSVLEGFQRLGYPASFILGLGILELGCTILYLIPKTSILGAVLLTGYLGGATATHLRVGEPFIAPVIVGVLVWGGLYLREKRLAPLLPLRK